MVSDHFYMNIRKVVYLPREWQNIDPNLNNHIYMESFKKVFKGDPTIPKINPNDKGTLFLYLQVGRVIIDSVEETELKSYWEVAKSPNRDL
jgi:hypothetical protein